MNAKSCLFAAALLLCATAPTSAQIQTIYATQQVAPSLTQTILKTASFEFQQLGYDYSYEFLVKEYDNGNVDIMELPNGEYRVSLSGNSVIIALEEMA